MLTYRQLVLGLRSLDIDIFKPVIVHSSFSTLGPIQGGVPTIIGALTDVFNKIMMPAFTYSTMVTPKVGPENNAMQYGSFDYLNKSAKIFSKNMPIDRLIGTIPEQFRQLPQTKRSDHPILSFCGINIDDILSSQTLSYPFKPIENLYEQDGTVLLIGVDHIANTSLHLAEAKAYRKSFIRWALTKQGIVECPQFPNCSGGFEKASVHLESITKHFTIGDAKIRVLPIKQMIDIATNLIEQDPYALLCEEENCERYQAVIKSLSY